MIQSLFRFWCWLTGRYCKWYLVKDNAKMQLTILDMSNYDQCYKFVIDQMVDGWKLTEVYSGLKDRTK